MRKVLEFLPQKSVGFARLKEFFCLNSVDFLETNRYNIEKVGRQITVTHTFPHFEKQKKNAPYFLKYRAFG